MNNVELLKNAEKAGFEYWAILDVKTIKLYPEVRKMCAANTCGMYEKNWSCPPGCGILEDCEEIVSNYNTGIIVQTVGEVKNSFDINGMLEIEDTHKKRSLKLDDLLRTIYKDILHLGVGACTICNQCTYPDKACRFPNKMISSLESFGVLVNELCKDNGLGYYYGPNTISYTSCFLILADS